MNAFLMRHVAEELRVARERELSGELEAAWRALERAHVLSQAHAWHHVAVHGRMLGFAWRRHRWREVLGQIPRIILAAPGSWLGRAPRGNTGGADVGIFTPMRVPDDLQQILDTGGTDDP